MSARPGPLLVGPIARGRGEQLFAFETVSKAPTYAGLADSFEYQPGPDGGPASLQGALLALIGASSGLVSQKAQNATGASTRRLKANRLYR